MGKGAWQAAARGNTRVRHNLATRPNAKQTKECILEPLCMCAKSLQSCPAPCDPVDGSPPRSSVHRILQARILGWVAMPSSRGSSWSGAGIRLSWASCVAGGFFPAESPGKHTRATILVQTFILLIQIAYTVSQPITYKSAWHCLHLWMKGLR